MSFFDTTPTGRVLNRFSKDITSVDDALASLWGLCSNWVVGSVAALVALAVVAPFSLVAVVPMGYFYRTVQKYYSTISRELRRIESITRSPIFALFTETLHGISTIRAFKRQKEFMEWNFKQLDLTISAYYIITAANRWYGPRYFHFNTT